MDKGPITRGKRKLMEMEASPDGPSKKVAEEKAQVVSFSGNINTVLPHELLIDIFAYLNWQTRRRAKKVCVLWEDLIQNTSSLKKYMRIDLAHPPRPPHPYLGREHLRKLRITHESNVGAVWVDDKLSYLSQLPNCFALVRHLRAQLDVLVLDRVVLNFSKYWFEIDEFLKRCAKTIEFRKVKIQNISLFMGPDFDTTKPEHALTRVVERFSVDTSKQSPSIWRQLLAHLDEKEAPTSAREKELLQKCVGKLTTRRRKFVEWHLETFNKGDKFQWSKIEDGTEFPPPLMQRLIISVAGLRFLYPNDSHPFYFDHM